MSSDNITDIISAQYEIEK